MDALEINPEMALTALQKIAEEIPSGVSAAEFGEIVTCIGSNPTEIADKIREDIASELKSKLAELWDVQQITEKLKKLKELPSADCAIKVPLSAETVVNEVSFQTFVEAKDMLKTRLKEVKEINAQLDCVVKTKQSALNRQISELKSSYTS